MHRVSLICALSALMAGCANFAGDLKKADATCASSTNLNDSISCFNTAEGAVWAKDSPGTFDDYSTFEMARTDLANRLTSKQISQAEYDNKLAMAKQALFAAQNKALQAEQAYNAQMTEKLLDSVLTSAAQGVAAASQARANTDAAVANSFAQHPLRLPQTTTCRTDAIVPSQVDCTTTNF